ncbi:hypothetical protein Scep_008025 [Stephania cephalantha]|uniref:Uncharacterized protein n=1 Tax=Stephania cephalantha TaxID=152367 RepID=A0AAP0KCP2_9MAGN
MIICTLMVEAFTTGLNVVEKSIPGTCIKPLATNLAVYRLMVPSVFFFNLYNHLLSTNVRSDEKGTKVQVLLA